MRWLVEWGTRNKCWYYQYFFPLVLFSPSIPLVLSLSLFLFLSHCHNIYIYIELHRFPCIRIRRRYRRKSVKSHGSLESLRSFSSLRDIIAQMSTEKQRHTHTHTHPPVRANPAGGSRVGIVVVVAAAAAVVLLLRGSSVLPPTPPRAHIGEFSVVSRALRTGFNFVRRVQTRDPPTPPPCRRRRYRACLITTTIIIYDFRPFPQTHIHLTHNIIIINIYNK